MIPVVEEFKSKFDELEPRERAAILMLSAFMGLVLFYLLIWSPAETYLADSRLEYDRHAKLLSYLRSTESEAMAASGEAGRQSLSGQSLLTAVSRNAQSIGVKPSRMQPEGSDAVSVWFDTVAFSQLMLWLERLEAQQSIVVRQITIDGRDSPGQVSARLVLRSS